jgi:transcriptional regulator with XRE-family HTH domain
MSDIKENIANNLTALRKGRKLTQSELAEKFNYSDKAVSKWEHGEAIPAVDTLQQLADFYGVTLDYITHESTPENRRLYAKTKTVIFNRNVIIGLSISLVWILATVATIGCQMINNFWYWMSFVWAIPASFIIGLIFNCVWGPETIRHWIVIGLTWTLLLSIYLELGMDLPNYQGWRLWMISLLGVPVTIGAILWSHLKVTPPSEQSHD